MSTKPLIVLALAVVCGIVAMVGVGKLSGSDEPPKMRKVLVAARELPIDEVLKPDDVKVVEREEQTVPAGSFSSFEELEGRWVRIRLLPDEPIVEPKLAPKGSPPGLIGRIPKGMRAMAVEVNEQSGVSGFVLPDHRVDVIRARNEPGGPRAETLLQDVLVLAAGTITARPEDPTIQVRTVTLAVTPQQAGILVAARTGGPLSLALRSLDDHGIVEPPPAPGPVPDIVSPVVARVPEPVPPPAPEPAPARPRPRPIFEHHGRVTYRWDYDEATHSRTRVIVRPDPSSEQVELLAGGPPGSLAPPPPGP